MVVRDTFLAELKTLFGLVVAGFEPGFSDPKARALPLRQSYAVPTPAYSEANTADPADVKVVQTGSDV